MDYSGNRLAFTSDHPLSGGTSTTDVYAFTLGGGTERVSRHPDGGTADGPSGQPAISGDGGTIAFVTSATNLDPVQADGNGVDDVFVYSLRDRFGRRIANTCGGDETDAASQRPALDYSGSRILFDSAASNLTGDSVEGRANVYVRTNPLVLERVFSAGFE
jgi:Tol biopolymer transport system component